MISSRRRCELLIRTHENRPREKRKLRLHADTKRETQHKTDVFTRYVRKIGPSLERFKRLFSELTSSTAGGIWHKHEDIDRMIETSVQQEGLAVASIARDDPSTLPGDDPFPRARIHRDRNWDRNLKLKLEMHGKA